MGLIYLTDPLEEIFNHSRMMGKLWFTLLIAFRIVLTVLGLELIYINDQHTFVCNTLQPDCKNMCYNAFAPLSNTMFWAFQIFMITTPTILYFTFALHKVERMEDNNQQSNDAEKHMSSVKQGVSCQNAEGKENGEEDSMIDEKIKPDEGKVKKAETQEKHNKRRHIKQVGLMKLYVIQLLARAVLEVAFLIGQYILYKFEVPGMYICTEFPCPHSVDCFVSRSTEKTIFLLIMYAVSFLGLLLTLLEILYLAFSCIKDAFRTCYQSTNTENLVDNRHTSSPPPGYNMSLKNDFANAEARNESTLYLVSSGDEVSSQKVFYQRKNLKPAKQQLDQARV